MKKQKITRIIETKDIETGKTETTKNNYYYIIKTWDELTTEEKEKEIENNSELIYQNYQDELYEDYQYELSEIKDKYKKNNFDDIYLDSNSQGGWIDSIKNFKYYDSINIYGETIDICDIDIHMCKYIKEITANDIDIYDYYIDSKKLEKIQATKKYKNWINNIVKDVNNWIDEVNEAAGYLIKNEYYYPSNLDDTNDRYFLDNYFCDSEFTYEVKEADYENIRK